MFACNLIPGKCTKCGSCCRFIYRDFESEKFKRVVFEKTGFLYLCDLNRLGISIQSYEYEKAISLGIKLTPKKVIFDEITQKTLVFDWSMDHDVCPMLRDNLCIIYKNRFDVCRAFPEYSRKIERVEELWCFAQEKIKKGEIKVSPDYEDALEKARRAEKVNFSGKV